MDDGEYIAMSYSMYENTLRLSFLPQIMLKFWRSGCDAHDLSSAKKLAPQISSVPESLVRWGMASSSTLLLLYVVYQTTKWIFQIWDFDDNTS